LRKLALDVRPGEYTVVKLDPVTPPGPELFAGPGLVSVTRTAGELSVVCPSESAPVGIESEPGWRLLTVRGPFEFTLTGILAALAGALAADGVPLFALSTFDTDHLLVKDADLARATDALREAGHDVVSQNPG